MKYDYRPDQSGATRMALTTLQERRLAFEQKAVGATGTAACVGCDDQMLNGARSRSFSRNLQLFKSKEGCASSSGLENELVTQSSSLVKSKASVFEAKAKEGQPKRESPALSHVKSRAAAFERQLSCSSSGGGDLIGARSPGSVARSLAAAFEQQCQLQQPQTPPLLQHCRQPSPPSVAKRVASSQA